MTVTIPDASILKIHPTENDISDVNYQGINANENNYSNNSWCSSPANVILPKLDGSGLETYDGGFAVSDGGGLNIDVGLADSRAFLNGRYVEMKAGVSDISDSLTASAINYVYLRVNVTGGKVPTVTSMEIVVDNKASGTLPDFIPNACLLAVAETDASGITNLEDVRPVGPQNESAPLWSHVYGSAGVINGEWTEISLPPKRNKIVVGGGYAVGLRGSSGSLTGADIIFRIDLELEGVAGSEIAQGKSQTVNFGTGTSYYDKMITNVYSHGAFDNLFSKIEGKTVRARLVLDIIDFGISASGLSLQVQTDGNLPKVSGSTISEITAFGFRAKSWRDNN